jgi:hypothetical protein
MMGVFEVVLRIPQFLVRHSIILRQGFYFEMMGGTERALKFYGEFHLGVEYEITFWANAKSNSKLHGSAKSSRASSARKSAQRRTQALLPRADRKRVSAARAQSPTSELGHVGCVGIFADAGQTRTRLRQSQQAHPALVQGRQAGKRHTSDHDSSRT